MRYGMVFCAGTGYNYGIDGGLIEKKGARKETLHRRLLSKEVGEISPARGKEVFRMKLLVWLKDDKQDFTQYVKRLLPEFEMTGLMTPGEDIAPGDFLAAPKECLREEKALSAAAQRLLQKRVHCGMKTVQSFPLQPGETLIKTSYSYFTKAYHGIPVETPVILRETSLANVYFVFDEALWTGSQVAFKNDRKGQDDAEESSLQPVGSIQSILGDLLMAALKGFAGELGAKAFTSIFNSSTNNFDALYRELKKIVRDELTQAEVDRVSGIIHGVGIYIKNTYTPQKDAGKSKEFLSSLLLPEVEKLASALGIMSQTRYQKLGFSAYLETVFEMVLLNQELAYIDPCASSPRASAYAVSVKRYAQEALTHIQTVYPQLNSDRKSFFSYAKYQEGHVVGHDIVVTYYFKWQDAYTGIASKRFEYDNDKDYDPEVDCRNCMEQAKTASLGVMDEDFKYPASVSALNQLIVNPLPK